MTARTATSAELDGPPAVRVHRFTIDEYHQMIDTGILAPDARVELVEGVIVEMTPMGSRHSALVAHLYRTLLARLPAGWHLRSQLPLQFERSEPEPDLVIVRGHELDYVERLPDAGDTSLVIEIADSSLAFDRGQKAPLYAGAGIPVYWIINLLDEQVEVHSDPAPTGYRSRSVIVRGGKLTLALEGQQALELDADDLLPAPRT